jgi:hypothetical protein
MEAYPGFAKESTETHSAAKTTSAVAGNPALASM